ncbi:MAG: glycoside hydrolase family 3 C-terminal domain-containing protein [Bacillales bacterium]|nr:glycoside hydrolase family 3 C-terminal domain-containing protein [Bacillales bacterium]
MTESEILSLIKKMSLYEKIGQLVCLGGQFFSSDCDTLTGPINNLGIDPKIIPYAGFASNLPLESYRTIQEEKIKNKKIPIMNVCDVIHGYKTMFPIPLSLASSFNMPLIKKCASLWAKEASLCGVSLSFAPMLDLARDPRWGRVMESFGEDPYLGECYAKAYINGMQGNLKAGTVGACVKHFAGYSLPEGGRDYQMSMITERVFNDYYLPPYISGIKAGALMVMSGFNALDFVPTCANQSLIKEYLIKKVKFDGVIISDYNAIHELVNHRVAENDKEACLIAFKNGITVDLMSDCYSNYLEELIKEGKVSEDELDKNVYKVLSLKNKLGIFDSPYRFSLEDEKDLDTKESIEKSYEAAAESMVLLKNDSILPLKKKNRVLFVGPFVKEKGFYGSWSLYKDKNMSSIEKCLKELNYSSYDVIDTPDIFDRSLYPEELFYIQKTASLFDRVVLLIGERQEESGEASSKGNISISSNIVELVKKVYEVNKNTVSVIFGGRPLVLTDIDKESSALLYAFIPGTMGSRALLDILYGKKNPSARLPMSLPYSVGQIPIYYQALPTGRPGYNKIEENKYYSHYIDQPNEPLYSFGCGLSYSNFVYSDLVLSSDKLSKEKPIKVSVKVKNISKIKGKEIILLYIRDHFGSVTRPDKELKGFAKISLSAGEEKEVSFTIQERDLRFSGIDYKKKSEPGKFSIYIEKLEKTFELI